MTRESVVAGNWKMYKTGQEAVEFVKNIASLVENSQAKVYLAVPFTAITPAVEAAKDTNIVIGAQNMHDASEGAFTGEIAGKMLLDAGAKFVILGHSERRVIFKETGEFINKKVKKALTDGLQPIVCIGESLEAREGGKMEEILKNQIQNSLAGLTEDDLSKIILAYEPIWAIGTGKTATSQIAEETQKFCRKCIEEIFGGVAAERLVIQYGGSVKPANAKELLSQENIDGVLVGGASLSPEVFSKIVNFEK